MLPWRPRRRLPAWIPLEGLDLADGDGVFALVVLAIVMLPVTILLAVYLVEWLLVLLLLPLVALVTAYAGRPWLVVARQGTGFPGHFRTRGQRRRYARGIRGWRESNRLIAEVRREVAETGAPRSLGEPGPLRPSRPRSIRRGLSAR